jgi:lipopolysaccharide export system protein LptC
MPQARKISRYSTFVSWVKIVLPLLALALLSSLVLFSRKVDPGAAIPFAQVDVDTLLREQGMRKPVFASVTSTGTSLSMNAVKIRNLPNGSDGALAEDVILDMAHPDGRMDQAKARQSQLLSDQNLLILIGDVDIFLDATHEMHTAQLEIFTEGDAAFAPGTVDMTGPKYDLTAGDMRYHTDPQTGERIVLFQNGVHLIYRPQN